MSHPLHPALVHFPVASWSLASIADVAALYWGEPLWQYAGVLMAVGVVTALAAMGSGMLELAKVDGDSPATPDIYRHMLLMMGSWCLYTTSLFLRWDDSKLIEPGLLALALSVAGFIVLAIGGWYGGKLVYTHSLGGDHQPRPSTIRHDAP